MRIFSSLYHLAVNLMARPKIILIIIVIVVAISGLLLFILQIAIRRAEQLRQRVAALERWRWNVEESPKRQAMLELNMAIRNLTSHLRAAGNEESAASSGEQHGVTEDYERDAVDLQNRVAFLAKVAVTAGVNSTEVLERLQQDRVEPGVELLRFIELFRS